MGNQTAGVSRGFVFLSACINTYHPDLSAWEPLLEPWQLLLHLDSSTHSRVCSGVSPGSWLRITSTQVGGGGGKEGG
jgi:hypothetical protein